MTEKLSDTGRKTLLDPSSAELKRAFRTTGPGKAAAAASSSPGTPGSAEKSSRASLSPK